LQLFVGPQQGVDRLELLDDAAGFLRLAPEIRLALPGFELFTFGQSGRQVKESPVTAASGQSVLRSGGAVREKRSW
jgi:hypothetical protein